jgi:hypothetical protein
MGIFAATWDCPEAPPLLSSGSPLPRHQQGMPLHAQIALPATVHRTAAVAADRDKHAQEQIDKPARYAGGGAVAVGASAPGRGIASLARMTATRCIQCIHGSYYLPDGTAAVSAAQRALSIAWINQAATSVDATLPPSPSRWSSATCSCLCFLMRRRAALGRWNAGGQASLLRASKSLICFSASSFVMP